MVHKTMLAIVAVWALSCVVGPLGTSTATAAHPDLFYNFYTRPSIKGGVPAQLYVSPLPTPPMVGHTYITYQPLMPHEFLYHHHRSYYKYDRAGGYTTGCVRWH